MAHSPQQYHNYPPYISPNSPTINYPPPEPYHPAKKPRLSGAQISPQSSPHLTNGMLPNPGFYSSSAPHMNGVPRQSSPPSAQQSPVVGTMGPPNRPVQEKEKAVDVNELGDVMASSGVDLKEQEALLLGGLARAGQQGDSFGSGPNSSFNSLYSTSQPGYFDHHTYGYNTLSQNAPGDLGSFYGAGTLNQRTVTPEEFDEQALRAEKRAIRRRNEIKQYHLNDPFLQAGLVSEKLKSRCNNIGIQLEKPRIVGPNTSLGANATSQINIAGPDNHPKLAVLKGKHLVAPPGNLAEILTLLSLSCKDRIRGLLEDSATFAKGRRSTSGGVVPPEFVSMATGAGKAEEATFKATSSASSLKRPFSVMNGDMLPTSETNSSQSVKSIAFPSKDGKVLSEVAGTERSLEAKREARRKERAVNGESGRAGSIGPGAPGSLGDKDADGAQKKPLTKKELKKQENSKATEAQQHAATNTAASLALGGGRSGPTWLKGSGGTKSWMTSKSSVNTSFAPMAKRESVAPTKAVAGATAPVKVGRTFGDFREDGVEGSGIQLRDVLVAMELDIKEKRALARAYGKVNSTKE